MLSPSQSQSALLGSSAGRLNHSLTPEKDGSWGEIAQSLMVTLNFALRLGIIGFAMGMLNPDLRRHSSLGYLSPEQYEQSRCVT